MSSHAALSTHWVLGWVQYHQTSSATFQSPTSKHHTSSVYRIAPISSSNGSGRVYRCNKAKQFLPGGNRGVCMVTCSIAHVKQYGLLNLGTYNHKYIFLVT